MSDSQALTEFGTVMVQGQTGLSPSESDTVTSHTVSAAAADLSLASLPGVGTQLKVPASVSSVIVLRFWQLACRLSHMIVQSRRIVYVVMKR